MTDSDRVLGLADRASSLSGAPPQLRGGNSQARSRDLQSFLQLTLPFVIVLIITNLNFRLVGDEGVYSLRVIELFAQTWPKLNFADYPVTSTPLAYVLMTGWGKLVGFEIWKLRGLTAFVTLLTAWVFYRLCKERQLPYPLLSTFTFLLFPYTFFLGFTLYPENFALLFGVASLYFYFTSHGSIPRTLAGSVLATLAVLSRQSYIVFPAAILGVDLLRRLCAGQAAVESSSAWRPLILAIPVLSFVPFFIMWGGVSPPMTQASQGGDFFLAITPTQLNYILIFVGFYFAPAVLSMRTEGLAKMGRSAWLVALGLLTIYVAFPVLLDDVRGNSRVAGILIHGLDSVGRVASVDLEIFAKSGLWGIGLVVVMIAFSDRPWTEMKTWLLAVALGYAGLMLITPLVYERYYMVLVPVLILLLHDRPQLRNAFACWLVVQAVLSASYFYWCAVLK
jgi:hypothetical protein